MKPLHELDVRPVRYLLADLDDTITTRGKLEAPAYAALEALQRAGKRIVIVTGRPAGWCDHIARMWPVDAVIGENGAFWFWHDGDRLNRQFVDDAPARAAQRARLAAIARSIVEEVPGAAVAADQAYRETDLAIDYCEDVPALPAAAAERIAALMRSAGLTAKVSSIHVNGWFGRYDKLAAARRCFAERFRADLDGARDQAVFVGDSPNDAPMFAFFERSVGVANVRRFPGLEPSYVTNAASGAGFVELAEHLLRHA